MSRSHTIAIAFVLALGATGSAHAQLGAPPPPPPGAPPPGYGYAPTPPPGPRRSGFLIGFSLGVGSFNCDDCGDDEAFSGLAFDLHLGGMIGPRMGLMYDGWVVSHAFDGGGSLLHVISTAALQLWIAPNLWLKGGLGVSRLSVSNERGETVAESDTGGAALVAAGFDVYQGRSFALDLQLRAGAAAYEDLGITMGSLNLGFNWY